MNRRIWLRGLRRLRYAVAVVLALLSVVYGSLTVYEFTHAADIDPRDRCKPLESGQCFTERLGVVGDSGSWFNVRVRYDDGRRSLGLFMESNSPRPGTKVRIEEWDGNVVALYDPARERRYRTNDWPQRWDWDWIVASALTLGLSLLVWPGFVRRVRRRVTRRAAGAPR